MKDEIERSTRVYVGTMVHKRSGDKYIHAILTKEEKITTITLDSKGNVIKQAHFTTNANAWNFRQYIGGEQGLVEQGGRTQFHRTGSTGRYIVHSSTAGIARADLLRLYNTTEQRSAREQIAKNMVEHPDAAMIITMRLNAIGGEVTTVHVAHYDNNGKIITTNRTENGRNVVVSTDDIMTGRVTGNAKAIIDSLGIKTEFENAPLKAADEGVKNNDLPELLRLNTLAKEANQFISQIDSERKKSCQSAAAKERYAELLSILNRE